MREHFLTTKVLIFNFKKIIKIGTVLTIFQRKVCPYYEAVCQVETCLYYYTSTHTIAFRIFKITEFLVENLITNLFRQLILKYIFYSRE